MSLGNACYAQVTHGEVRPSDSTGHRRVGFSVLRLGFVWKGQVGRREVWFGVCAIGKPYEQAFDGDVTHGDVGPREVWRGLVRTFG